MKIKEVLTIFALELRVDWQGVYDRHTTCHNGGSSRTKKTKTKTKNITRDIQNNITTNHNNKNEKQRQTNLLKDHFQQIGEETSESGQQNNKITNQKRIRIRQTDLQKTRSKQGTKQKTNHRELSQGSLWMMQHSKWHFKTLENYGMTNMVWHTTKPSPQSTSALLASSDLQQ